MVACAIWAIWASRKKLIHEGEQSLGQKIIDFLYNYLRELDGLKKCSKRIVMSMTMCVVSSSMVRFVLTLEALIWLIK